MDAFFAEDLGGHYITVIEARAHTFGQAVTAIAEGVPALVHCTEGKDRTGLLVALVMSAAGVLADPIVEDYALTGQWRPDRALAYASHFEAAGVPLESFRVLYESPAVAMRMALDHLRAEYGTVTNYLTSRAGVTEDAIQRLRACLVAGSSRDQADRETI
jgi:protein-tyrosine phosphatase